MKLLRTNVEARGFLLSGKGAIALTGALLVIPMLGSGLLAFEAIHYHSVDLRLGRAVAVNAVFGAKEGPAAAAGELQSVQERLVRFNTGSVLGSGEPEKIVLGSDADDGEGSGDEETSFSNASATLPYEAIYAPLLKAKITEVEDTAITAENRFRAERRRIKTEYALVLDASASMQNYNSIENVRDGLRGFVNNLFGSDETSSDVWVSIVEFSDNVNIGARYADELITPESQTIPRYRGRQATRGGNRVASLVAREKGYSNFLDSRGPEAARGGACVARKSNAGNTDWLPMAAGEGLSAAYADLLENPPRSQRRGFDLLMGEGDASCERRTTCESDERVYGQCPCKTRGRNPPKDLKLSQGQGERGLAPADIRAIDYLRLDRSVYTVQFAKDYPGDWDYAVSAYPGCGQPMLVASNSRRELLRHIGGYSGIYQTAADEGFAWGYRALHPNWRDVWHSASDGRGITEGVPADFSSEVRKKFIYFSDGFSNEGYFASSPTSPSAHNSVSNIARFCQYMKGESLSSPREEGDIEVTVVILGDGEDFGSGALNVTRRNCPSTSEARHYIQSRNPKEIRDFLIDLGRAEYEARLVPR